MAVKLRLRRIGKKKQPVYKLVAADARSPRDGKFLEAVGLYNPLTNPHTIDLKEDRVFYWLNVGAQPTNTVKSLLRQKGIILKKNLMSKGLDEEKIKAELDEWHKMKEAGSRKKLEKKSAKKKKTEDTTFADSEEKTAEAPGEDGLKAKSTAEENSAASE